MRRRWILAIIMALSGAYSTISVAQACCKETYGNDHVRHDLCLFRYNNCVDRFPKTKKTWRGTRFSNAERFEQCCNQVKAEVNVVIRKCLASRDECDSQALYNVIKRAEPNREVAGESNETEE